MNTLKINERVSIIIPSIEYQIVTTSGLKFIISFLHKRSDGVIMDGITNEDILAILMDRLRQQNSKKSDRFNNKALFHLGEAQRQLEERSFYMRAFKEQKKEQNKK